MKPIDIEKRASEIVAAKLASGEIVQMEWAIYALISSMGTIEGPGTEFYQLCAREYARKSIKDAIEKYEGDLKRQDPEQLTMEGYEQLRIAYSVKRDGERVLCPLDRLTDDEIKERAENYFAQAATMMLHGNELMTYLKKRQMSRSA